MSDKEDRTIVSDDAARAAWEKPELRQLDALSAEFNPSSNVDNAVLS